MLLNKPKMESLIVHLKNQMELNALKSVMKEMELNMKNFTPEIIKQNLL